jgi:hypothetical protein
MKLEDQVCSFEQAVKLEKLTVHHNSIFYWNLYRDYAPKVVISKNPIGGIYFNTYTVSELIEMLPKKIRHSPYFYHLIIEPDDKGWGAAYLAKDSIEKKILISINTTEGVPYLLSEILIWLIENNHIKPKDINV